MPANANFRSQEWGGAGLPSTLRNHKMAQAWCVSLINICVVLAALSSSRQHSASVCWQADVETFI